MNPNARVGVTDHANDAANLVVHLLGRAEDVRVVLAKRSHAGQPVHGAGPLVAVQSAEIREPHRQIAIRAKIFAVDEAVRRTVHRLHGEVATFDLREVHVVLVVIVVARTVPQIALENLRRDDLVVAVLP